MFLSGCALVPAAEEAVADVEQGSSETRTYPLSEEQALNVIAGAIAEGWPDKSTERLRSTVSESWPKRYQEVTVMRFA